MLTEHRRWTRLANRGISPDAMLKGAEEEIQRLQELHAAKDRTISEQRTEVLCLHAEIQRLRVLLNVVIDAPADGAEMVEVQAKNVKR